MLGGCSLFTPGSSRTPDGSGFGEDSSPAVGAAAQPATAPPPPETVRLTVRIKGFEFRPRRAKVRVGDTVAWLNQDPVAHTVTGNGWDSGTLNPGFEFRYRFSSPGEYEYRSMFNPMARGKITVR